jgi:ABC-type multidrug transport system permease subunit
LNRYMFADRYKSVILITVTYAVDALRSVLIRGWGLAVFWVQLLALLGFAAIFLRVLCTC